MAGHIAPKAKTFQKRKMFVFGTLFFTPLSDGLFLHKGEPTYRSTHKLLEQNRNIKLDSVSCWLSGSRTVESVIYQNMQNSWVSVARVDWHIQKFLQIKVTTETEGFVLSLPVLRAALKVCVCLLSSPMPCCRESSRAYQTRRKRSSCRSPAFIHSMPSCCPSKLSASR